ncbi:MAG TPA: hypothetical protein VNO81_12640, partial [Candidatus Nitrosotenuis sp.]|nr:hypothetical protein [Candidatus Nitrosotenuis sp.]
MELAVYMFLALVAAGLIVSLFVVGRRTSEATYSSYLVSRDTETAINWLREDLAQASLGSLRVYPSSASSGERPGVSMQSAVDYDDPSRLTISRQGSPRFASYVFYTLAPTSGSTGGLVRWVSKPAGDQRVPLPSTLLPSTVSDGTHQRTVLRDLVLPGVQVAGVGKVDEFGGFRVRFVRRQGGEAGPESLSDVNPAQIS